MDFLACIVVKTTLQIDELRKLVNAIPFQPAVHQNNSVAVEVMAVKDALESDYLKYSQILFSVENVDDTYVIMVYDGGYDCLFDIRGH